MHSSELTRTNETVLAAVQILLLNLTAMPHSTVQYRRFAVVIILNPTAKLHFHLLTQLYFSIACIKLLLLTLLLHSICCSHKINRTENNPSHHSSTSKLYW